MIYNRFHYQILRYIPDLNRMEPRNFGVVVQGTGQIKFRINRRFAQKGFVDTEAFRQWRQFLEKEINDEQTEQLNLFRPAKDSPEFLDHLNRMIRGNFTLSRPMLTEYRHAIEIDSVLDDLFETLVADKEDKEAVLVTRPTGKFRATSEEEQFVLANEIDVYLPQLKEVVGF
jgi:hypothetical protein